MWPPCSSACCKPVRRARRASKTAPGNCAALFERFKSDLVVTDLMMPGLSGFEVIRAKKWIRPYNIQRTPTYYTKDTHLLALDDRRVR